MTWFVHFIPNECDSISVLINNAFWRTWFRTAGEVTWALPQRYQGVGQLKVSASVSPEGKNGSMEVKWDDRVIQRYDFDDFEPHDVSNAPPSPPREPNGPRGPREITIAKSDKENENTHYEFEYGVSSEPGSHEMLTRVSVFSSGVLTNKSDQPPESGLRTSLSVPIDKEVITVPAETKTFRSWAQGGGPLQTGAVEKWILRSSDSTALAALGTITVTLLRATDPQTQALFVQATLGFRQTSLGWRVPFADHGGLRVRIWFLNAVDGVLEEWEVTPTQSIKCGDNNAYFEFKKNVTPDWYDRVVAVLLIIDPNTWYRC